MHDLSRGLVLGVATGAFALLTILGLGCSSGSGNASSGTRVGPFGDRHTTTNDSTSTSGTRSGGASAPNTASRGRNDLPAAIASGVAIDRDRMFTRMAEATGGAVLEELVLDQRLTEEARRRGITITDTDLANERRALVDAIRRASDLADREAEEALLGVRRRRGLGPQRFDALLRRNAILRKLTAQSVVVTEDDLRLAHRIRYGERYMLSLIVTADERNAATARRLLLANQPVAAVASEYSIDPSAAVGGRVGPISPFDPALPEALTSSLRSLGTGRFSPVIAVENGFAIVRIDEALPARAVELDSVRTELTAEIRRVRERSEMDRFARSLIDLSQITVFDTSLRWSWESGANPQGEMGGTR